MQEPADACRGRKDGGPAMDRGRRLLRLAGRAVAGPLEVAPPPPADALTVEI
jgi:hypothetical protein